MSAADRPHPEGRGVRFASRRGADDVREAYKEYYSLNTRGARAAYADSWIGRWSRDFDKAWPMLYELLKIVEEDELYKDPRRVGPGAAGEAHGDKSGYASFAEYFEDRVGQSFQTWSELESTYRYVQTYKPELFSERLDRAQRQVEELQRRVEGGMQINAADNHHPDPGRNIIPTSVEGVRGTNAEYLTKRLVRDHPDIADRLAAGEFKSVRAAGLAAGIAPRTLSVRITDPASVARSLRKHMSPDRLGELVALLLETDTSVRENNSRGQSSG